MRIGGLMLPLLPLIAEDVPYDARLDCVVRAPAEEKAEAQEGDGEEKANDGEEKVLLVLDDDALGLAILPFLGAVDERS